MFRAVQPLLATWAQAVTRRFARQTQQVQAVQAQFLQQLGREYQDTELGRRYQLAKIASVEQFRQQIPVSRYDTYAPYAERIAAGEPNVLTPDPVAYLNLTSGSTGHKKRIPVTARSRQVLARARQVSTAFGILAAQAGGGSTGKLLVTSSTQLWGETSGGIPYGPVSVGHLRSLSGLSRQLLAPPLAALAIADSRARHYVCLLAALGETYLRAIAATFPVLALQMAQYLADDAELLLADLARGTLTDELPIEPELRAQLQAQRRPQPLRATELRRHLDRHGRLRPRDAWPHLSLLITPWGGASPFYIEQCPAHFGPVPVFGGVYSSAEATFGVYYQANNEGNILAINSGFFEFVPRDRWQDEQPATLLPHEVSVGERYRLLVTNYHGFYRYDIGDVVEVVGFYHQTPILAFRYRAGGWLSAINEKTTELQIVEAIRPLQAEFAVQLTNFCVTLSRAEIPPRYLVNIELASGQRLAAPDQFLAGFDRALQELHVSYAVKRRGQELPPPRLRLLAPGSFARKYQELYQQGVPESHLKFPHLHGDRDFLAGLAVESEVDLPA